MLRSMTGYGRGSAAFSGGTLTAELRAVNSRFLDCTVKTPRLYGYLEDEAKKLVAAATSRGKVDVYITIEPSGDSGTEIELDRALVNAYINAFKTLESDFGVQSKLSAETFARLPDVMRVKKTEIDSETVTNALRTAFGAAAETFGAMRTAEGRRMSDDMRSRVTEIERLCSLVEERSPRLVREYREKLEARMRELLDGREIDETRLITETAVYADKIAVAEETVRLRSHLAQFVAMLGENNPVGRKLDFLVQEMNREANTTGSKINDAELARVVVDMKSEIEKIREQVQNVE